MILEILASRRGVKGNLETRQWDGWAQDKSAWEIWEMPDMEGERGELSMAMVMF